MQNSNKIFWTESIVCNLIAYGQKLTIVKKSSKKRTDRDWDENENIIVVSGHSWWKTSSMIVVL